MSRLVLALLVVCLQLTACARDTKRPNVLVVVIDTLRADRLGAYGNGRGLTPFLDQLAGRGTLFERAYATSSWTMPSVASLLTSRYPMQHQVTGFASRLADDEITLPEVLRDAGWRVGGFSANPNLRVEAGFGQGFDQFWVNQTAEVDVPGDALRAQAVAWVDRARAEAPEAPLALYLQYMEPHEPYRPAEPFRSRFAVGEDGKPFDLAAMIRSMIERVYPDAAVDDQGRPADLKVAFERFLKHRKPTSEELAVVGRLHARSQELLYDAEVAAADEQVRLLFADLEAHGFLQDDTVIVVTADHGEEFYEHGGTTHGYTLYEESVRIPLIVIGRDVPRGRRVGENVSLVDVAPTLLDVLHLPVPPPSEGASVLPGTKSPPRASEDVLLQLERLLGGSHQDRRKHMRGFVRNREKLLIGLDGTSEMYDLATDPRETHRVQPGDVERLRAALSSVEASLAPPTGAVQVAPVDDAQKARLRALGYVQ